MHSSGITRQPNATAATEPLAVLPGTARSASAAHVPNLSHAKDGHGKHKIMPTNWWTWQTQMTSRVFIESQGFAADSLCSCLPKANFCDIDSRTRTCKDTRNVLNRYSKYMQIHANTCRHSYWHFCTRQVIFGSQLNASVEMRNGWDGSNHEAQAASFPAIGDKSSTLQTSNTKMLQTFGFRVKRFYPRQTNKVFSWRMLRVRTLGLCRFQRETALRSDCENKVSYILL